MRATLALDEDVAAQVDKLRRERGASLKVIVNEVMRRGLIEMRRPKHQRACKTKTVDLGEPLISLDNMAEAIACAEGEDYT